jgi:hypothetical protein
MKIFLTIAAMTAAQIVHSVEPLVEFEFETTLQNSGSLGSEAHLETFATGEEPFFGTAPFGNCLDLTAASRHGGATPQDPPAGGAVFFNNPQLNKLQSYTIVLWARQNPQYTEDNAARMLQKKNAWDLLPHTSGMTLMLGPGSKKVSYMLRCGKPQKLSQAWTFFAVSVTPQQISGCKGRIGEPLHWANELERRENFDSGDELLEIGNFNRIRPFNGWIDNLRIFDVALTQVQLTNIFAEDSSQASALDAPAVYSIKQSTPPPRNFKLNASAIPFSTRWQRRDDALTVMQSFHATHCLWVYGTETQFIQKVRSNNIFYQGALNGLQGREHATTNLTARGDNSGRHEDLDGNKNMPHWMVAFSPRHFTGCCNNPAFRNFFFTDAKKLLDSGVDAIHVDDWGMNGNWVLNVNGGVCFCDACRQGFREWLEQKYSAADLKKLGIDSIADFDYRQHLKNNGIPDAQTYQLKLRELPLTPMFVDFQIESTRQFYREFRDQLDRWSPDKYIPVSINAQLTPRQLERTLHAVDVVDFLDGEASQSVDFQDARSNILAAKMADAVGIPHIVSPVPRGTARTRASIATAYALGQFHLVPWDIYMGSDATGSQPRYFGTQKQYGDLYRFIHEQRALFDNSTAVAEIGVLINCDEPDDYTAICSALTELQLPYHIIPVARRYSQIPLRTQALEGLRLLINNSPDTTLAPDDQKTLNSFRDRHLLRFAHSDIDLNAVSRLMKLDLMRVEGPDNIFAFLRINKKSHAAAIHLVNWNFQDEAEQVERYANVTLSLQQPRRWGEIKSITLHEPEKPAQQLTAEQHSDCIRIPVAELKTWCIIEIQLHDNMLP